MYARKFIEIPFNASRARRAGHTYYGEFKFLGLHGGQIGAQKGD
ncbi:hypothetical protein NSMM_1080029 [Nitrosomonas mobilis]|uniref:Uncharacterized protein n=1 Tax=Nitrosomonas mobilis TaxID=51642 RepID=A0A1G5SCL7_9PROT|nr:hypothetical protein NSMM_1080029 [Nitrosomonas mobilis]